MNYSSFQSLNSSINLPLRRSRLSGSLNNSSNTNLDQDLAAVSSRLLSLQQDLVCILQRDLVCLFRFSKVMFQAHSRSSQLLLNSSQCLSSNNSNPRSRNSSSNTSLHPDLEAVNSRLSLRQDLVCLNINYFVSDI